MYNHTVGSGLNTMEVNNYVFFRGTGPIDADAQICRKVFISDDYLTMPTKICGNTSMNSINILILNDGCTTVVSGDNTGKP